MNVKRIGLLVAVILILLVVLSPGNLPRAAQWLDVGGPPKKADAVVLLNGSYSIRPFVVAALVHGGWAPKVLLNTVADHPDQTESVIPHSFDISVKTLAYGGVDRHQIERLDTAASTTFDEAQGVANYLAEHPARRLLIVTEGPHTRRARWIFQRVLAGLPVEIVMVSAPSDEFNNANWWRSEAGFLFVVSEYLKLFYYALRYGWLGYQMVVGSVLGLLIFAWFWRHRKLEGIREKFPTSNSADH
jgi:uncharacterized SAM-binding protein YcdF (DUF218 family)